MIDDETKVIDVDHCARCSGDHPVTFKRFAGNPIVDDDGTAWDWWGICPATGDPVLLRGDKLP
jgi:hypothetical protein